MTPREIKLKVEEATDLNLKSPNRKMTYSNARAMYFKLCQEFALVNHTWEEIGAELERDHATALHGAKIAFEKRVQNKRFKEIYFELYNHLSDLYYIEREAISEGLEADNPGQLTELKAKYDDLLKKERENVLKLKMALDNMSSNLEDPIIAQIVDLDPDQLKIFKERASVMIKSVQNIRTYSNTNKSSFNPVENGLKIAQL